MKRCKTCRWYVEAHARRVCGCPKIGESGWLREHGTAKDDDVLCYPYDEGAEIETGPEFGCVHHEEGS